MRLWALLGVTRPHELALGHHGVALDGTGEVDQRVDQFVARAGYALTRDQATGGQGFARGEGCLARACGVWQADIHREQPADPA